MPDNVFPTKSENQAKQCFLWRTMKVSFSSISYNNTCSMGNGTFFSSYWYIEFPPISILNMEPSVIMYIITAYTHSSMNGRWTPLQHRISLPLRLRHWVKMINGMIALFCAPGTFSPHTNFIAKIFVVGRTCIFVAEPNKQNLLRYFSKFSRHAIIWRGLKN